MTERVLVELDLPDRMVAALAVTHSLGFMMRADQIASAGVGLFPGESLTRLVPATVAISRGVLTPLMEGAA